MTLTTRPFDTTSDRDWQRVRQLLIDTHPITGPEFNWDIRHWDGNRYHNPGPAWRPEKYANFQVWETPEGVLAGVAYFEGDDLCLQIHPKFRAEMEESMLNWGMKTFKGMPPITSGPHALYLTVWDYDLPRQRLLKQNNFDMTGYTWCHRVLHFAGQPLPVVRPVPDYGLRTTDPTSTEDARRMVELLNVAFSRPGFHQPEEYTNFMQRSPSFCNDLNLVAITREGQFAAHAAVTIDPVNHVGVFEPVCTHPDHHRKGLAKGIMSELLRRAQKMGAAHMTVSTGSGEAANGLYDSLGFSEYYQAHVWRRLF